MDKTAAEALSDTLRTELAGSAKYHVLERKFLGKILDELKLQATGVVDESQALKVGKLSAADVVVLGSLTNVGSLWMVNVRVVEVESGQSIGGKSFSTKSQDKMADMIAKAAKYVDNQ